MHKNMQTEMQIDAIAMLRTDGRTNGRPTHLPETSSVSYRAGEIREFELDPETGATPEWEAFVARLDPEQLERERFHKPHRSERPGSPQDRFMRDGHKVQVAAFRAAVARMDAKWDVDAWMHRHDNALTEDHVRIAIAAAESRGHAA